MSEEGIRRSAILLMSLGEEQAVEVFRFLGPREVQKLGAAMAKLTSVSPEQVAEVLREFRRDARKQTSIGASSEQFVRTVLTRALGSDRAAALIDRILQGQHDSGIENLKWMDAASIAELIRNEHPQIVAAILVHFDADQAGEVLTVLPERLRNEAVLRIATLEGLQPAALRELNEVLAQLLSGTDAVKGSAKGGIEAATQILNRLPGTLEASVSAHIREVDPDLAQKIQDKMFAFESLLDLSDAAIRLLLREIQSETLLTALKGASEQLKEKVLRNLSQGAAEMLRDDLEAKGPVRLSQVESAQREVLRVVRRLAERGQIVAGGKSEVSLVQ